MANLVRISDELVQRADVLAQETSKSLEEVVAEALEEYILKQRREQEVEEINALVGELGQPLDDVHTHAAAIMLRRVEW